MLKFLANLLDGNEREIKRYSRRVGDINELEPQMERLSDEGLRALTPRFRERLEHGEPLSDLLPEAFAAVREAARRTLDMRHFDVQLIGGMVLHDGRIAEMATGEGKTLVATLSAYLNALTGKGAHIVTVNDYLARRDSEWMGEVYRFMGLEVGLIVHGLQYDERRRAYSADVTYGTNNELGFDYLRDNMVLKPENMVQREHHYAIVDEVDSILIDEARTPLIISGPGTQSTELYYKFAKVIHYLQEGRDYVVDEKAHTVHPSEEGVERVEKLLGLRNMFDQQHMDLSHYLTAALKAQTLMRRDRDYIIKDGEVVIVDEFTGRLMFGRRYSDGLHQAIEAKENLRVEKESQTLATITFQNFFRMYDKLAGMTGTAKTEEEEFMKIYGMDVVVVPTNRSMIRRALPDVIYKTEEAKFRAVVGDISECYERRRPVLVGTVSIEKSERLSRLLRHEGIPHEVLNAKYHEKEAEIVAQAGRPGVVTIATNMAGRGTDIVLGPGVADNGGLHVIGTERHDARRIDNQLRGRSGRQGDPGSSRFYLSLEDDLMRLFGGDHISGLMDRLGIEEDEPIDHPLITRAVEMAQKRVETRNFDIRRHVLEYDDVMNRQREVIYDQRRRILQGADLRRNVLDMMDTVAERLCDLYAHESVLPEDRDLKGLLTAAETTLIPPGSLSLEELRGIERRAELEQELLDAARSHYEAKEKAFGEAALREMERFIMLRVVDSKWMEHLDAMDDLREGITLRAYGQRDPLLEYKKEAYDMFQSLVGAIQEDIVRYVSKMTLVRDEGGEYRMALEGQGTRQRSARSRERTDAVRAPAPQAQAAAVGGNGSPRQPVRVDRKVGRNDPCPCGSGKKYKKCCGRGD